MNNHSEILSAIIVDNDKVSRRHLAKELRRCDFDAESMDPINFDDKTLEECKPDFLVMSPDVAYELIKSHPSEKVSKVVLFEKRSSHEAVFFLDQGFDQYIDRSACTEEIASTLRAVQRRRNRPAVRHILDIGDLTVDLDLKTVTKNNKPIYLTQAQRLLFFSLAKSRGRVLNLEDIAKKDDKDFNFSVSGLRVHLRALREKLKGDEEIDDSIIKTVHGRMGGYTFSEPCLERVYRIPKPQI